MRVLGHCPVDEFEVVFVNFAAIRTNKLDAYWNTLRCPMQGQADGRLTRCIECRGERDEIGSNFHWAHRRRFVIFKLSNLERDTTDRWREQDVPAVGPPLRNGTSIQ